MIETRGLVAPIEAADAMVQAANVTLQCQEHAGGGLVTIMLLCGFCCAWLGELVPQSVPIAKYVGAAYILYLAYRTFMRSPGSSDTDKASKPLTCVNGFLLQFLNVKILMLGIAAYSGYILPHGFSVPAVLCFALIMAACAGTGNLTGATLGRLHLPRHIDNLCQRQCAFMIQVPDVNLLALRAGDINCLLHECSFAFSN